MQQLNFVKQIVNTDNQVTGCLLVLNRISILFLKCMYLRRKQKLTTIFEIIIPILLFYACIKQTDKTYNFTSRQPPPETSADAKLRSFFFNLKPQDRLFRFKFPLFYDFDNKTVNGTQLKDFLMPIFKDKLKRFESDPDEPSLLAYFNKFTNRSIDYKIKAFNLVHDYGDWFQMSSLEENNDDDYGRLMERKEVDKIHELILEAISRRLNLSSNYGIDQSFSEINFYKKPEKTKSKSKYYNPGLIDGYIISFYFSFTIQFFFVIVSVCKEKKNRSYDFLKLMTASDGEIYFGYFMDHFLIWFAALLINFSYFWYILPSGAIPFNLAFILVIFNILFLIHYICFLFLMSAPFRQHLLAEAFFLFSVITTGSLTKYEYEFLNIALVFNPFFMMFEFRKICQNSLAVEFNFKENLLTIFTRSSHNEMSLLSLLIITIIWIIIEIILTNYVLQVNPFQKAIPKPFFYFLSIDYWCKPKTVINYIAPKQKEFEEVSSTKKPALILKNVNKSFFSWFNSKSKFQVLKDFNFAIYEKQITILLGHNGAGKTTTMELIAGLSNPDSGTISVKGVPVSSFSTDYKTVLGYCPQENIFYESLSVYKNLQIASILKGVSWNSSKTRIIKLAEQFDLQSKLDQSASKLSGGMKRRLCLAMALTGFNEVLVIDEPTSGLDPENRRKVWDILLFLRKYRTILLTTHFMEEADILGDSIAIMQGGKVKCSGSTLFLKKLYHVGYLLRLELNKSVKDTEILNFVQEYIPDAIYENRRENEYFIRLVLNQQNDNAGNLNLMIANLLENFEKEETKNKFGIQAYGLTNTSLEDVFIKTGTLNETNHEMIDMENVENHPLHDLNRVDGLSLFIRQFCAILIKKFKLSYRSLSLLISSLYLLITPVLSVFLLTLFLNSRNTYDTLFKGPFIKSFSLNKISGNHKMEVMLLNSSFPEKTDLFRDQNHGWLIKEFGFNFVKSNQTDIQIAVDQETERIGYDKIKKTLLFIPERINETHYKFHINQFKLPYSMISTIEMFYRAMAIDANPESNFDINLKFEMVNRGDMSDLKITFLFIEFCCLFFICIMLSFPFIVFIGHLHDEINSGALEMQIIAGLSKTLYWFGNFAFDYMLSIFIVFISCILVYYNDDYKIFSCEILNIFALFAVTCFNCILIVYFLINLSLSREFTEALAKYSFFIAGSLIGITDLILQLTHFSEEIVISKLDPNTTIDKIDMPYSFLFKIFSPVYNMFDMFDSYLLDFEVNQCIKNGRFDNCEILNIKQFDSNQNQLAFLISSSIFAFFIIFINYNATLAKKLSTYLNAVSVRLMKKKSPLDQHELVPTSNSVIDINYISRLENIEDSNVEKEKELTQMLIENNNLQSNLLVVHQLYKLFGHFEAVDHICFTVKREECFGLLGVNGAGKSTTFRLIGGSIMPTSGQIILDDYTFDKNPYEYYRKLGYCPQQNTHTKKLTVLDNLRYYARINGIPTNLTERAVFKLIEECDLEDHRFKYSEDLSGGNQRKLSTAISLIGKKDLILLDEPTTGVDPIARRKLWKTIEFYKKKLKTSFILTSHSMDEVEQLCSKISIMVAGKFKAMGTFSYLKNKYSQGFTITIKIKETIPDKKDYTTNLKDRMSKDFDNKATCKEFYMNTIVFILPKTFKWSDQFRIMEKIKVDFDLEDFLVQETNLEQVFLSFAKK